MPAKATADPVSSEPTPDLAAAASPTESVEQPATPMPALVPAPKSSAPKVHKGLSPQAPEGMKQRTLAALDAEPKDTIAPHESEATEFINGVPYLKFFTNGCVATWVPAISEPIDVPTSIAKRYRENRQATSVSRQKYRIEGDAEPVVIQTL